jgi:hypothetical protein
VPHAATAAAAAAGAATAAATAAVRIACRCRNDARVHGQINGGAGRKRKSAGGALSRHAAPERVVAVHEHRRRGHRGQRARAGDFQIGMHAFVELHAAAVAAGCTPRNGRHALVRSEAAAAALPWELSEHERADLDRLAFASRARMPANPFQSA